jgi:hypothetical protein
MGEIVFVAAAVAGVVIVCRILGMLGRSNLFVIAWGVSCVVLSFWMIGQAYLPHFFGGQ